VLDRGDRGDRGDRDRLPLEGSKSGNQTVIKQGAFLAHFRAFWRASAERGTTAENGCKALKGNGLRWIFEPD
jgi:hypothetical protein